MSIQAVAWAINQEVEFAPKFILVCLANYADDDGECWPSLKTLARDAGCGVRSVQRYLDVLVDQGLVEKVETAGERGRFSSLLFRLPVPQSKKSTGGQSGRRSNRPTVKAVMSPVATAGVHEPLVEPLEEESLSLSGERDSSSVGLPCEADARLRSLTGARASADSAEQSTTAWAELGPTVKGPFEKPFLNKRKSEMTAEERALARRLAEAE